MKKLPIGISSFEQIRSGDYIYVDKTQIVYDLIEHVKYTILVRPYKFGKSLLADTIKCIFEGRKELFEGLAIYDKWDWNDKYPVVMITWDDDDLNNLDTIEKKFTESVKKNAERLGVELKLKDYGDSPSILFSELVRKAREKYKKRTVVLIDDFDKPVRVNIHKTEEVIEIRRFLMGAYYSLKSEDEHLEYGFMIGSSYPILANMFGGLNHMYNASTHPNLGNICGFTEEELKTYFSDHLKNVDMAKLKEWYNGYYWFTDKIFNPYSVLSFFNNNYEYKNYWFESISHTSLLEYLLKNKESIPYVLEPLGDSSTLNQYDVEYMRIETLIFQTGYLTVDRMEELGWRRTYYLRMPNLEVKSSFPKKLLDNYLNSEDLKNQLIEEGKQSFLEGNLEKLKEILIKLYTNTTLHNVEEKVKELYVPLYSSMVYAYFYSLGFDIFLEEDDSYGFLDFAVKVEDKIYIFEYKANIKNRMEEIRKREYLKNYLEQYAEVYKIDILMDSDTRNISKYKWEKLK